MCWEHCTYLSYKNTVPLLELLFDCQIQPIRILIRFDIFGPRGKTRGHNHEKIQLGQKYCVNTNKKTTSTKWQFESRFFFLNVILDTSHYNWLISSVSNSKLQKKWVDFRYDFFFQMVIVQKMKWVTSNVYTPFNIAGKQKIQQ